jgi:hypothetical protein
MPSPRISSAFRYGLRYSAPSGVFSPRSARRTVTYDSALLGSITALGTAPRSPRHETR